MTLPGRLPADGQQTQVRATTPAQPDQFGPPVDYTGPTSRASAGQPRVVSLAVMPAPDDGANRYLALQQRVFFEMLGGIERQFGREHAVEIVAALAKKYPDGS